MNQSNRRAARAALLLPLLVVIGCTKPATKPVVVPVSGAVMFDGKPLADGIVYFKTDLTGTFEAFTVTDGKFDGNAEVGERRVEINSYRVRPMKDDPMGGDIKENVIPTNYNAESTLTATVTAAGPNTFTFEVKSK